MKKIGAIVTSGHFQTKPSIPLDGHTANNASAQAFSRNAMRTSTMHMRDGTDPDVPALPELFEVSTLWFLKPTIQR